MTPSDAAQLLGLDASARPEQIEARFLELRTKLEDRIAKAPTPGLKEKYRTSLNEITAAFETLALAADGSDLPVLQQQQTSPAAATLPRPAPAEPAAPATAPTGPRPRPGKSNKEFIAVVLLAVVLLAGGGWWIWQARVAAAERARVEAAARAAAEQERLRQETLLTQLRARQAEAKIRWDVLEREGQAAERRLAELRNDLRNLRELAPPLQAELQARFDAQSEYVSWVQPHLTRHPVNTHLARLEAFLAAKAVDEAAAVDETLAAALAAAEQEVRDQSDLLLTLEGPVEIVSEPAGLAFTATDAYGRSIEGVTPYEQDLPLGALAVRISRGAGWEDASHATRVKRRETTTVASTFAEGTLTLTSEPAGLNFEIRNGLGYINRGSTPATVSGVPSGEVAVQILREGWPAVRRVVQLSAGGTETVAAAFRTGGLALNSTPSGATVLREGRELGQTPLALADLIPGEVELTLQHPGYLPQAVRATVVAEQVEPVEVELVLIPLPKAGQPHENTLGMRFVPVPGTPVLFGVWETRRADYAAFAAATQRPATPGMWAYDQAGNWGPQAQNNWTDPGFAQDDRHPVVGVTREDALAFCRWLTERERSAGRLGPNQHYRLPTDAEWSLAVGLAENAQAAPKDKHHRNPRVYPWGTAYPPPAGSGNYLDMASRRISATWTIIEGYDDGYAYTAPVGSYSANRYGIHDLGGNVWEWCQDLYDPAVPGRYVLRGSGWNVRLEFLASDTRVNDQSTMAGAAIGFRCVLDTSEDAAARPAAAGGTATVHIIRQARPASLMGGLMSAGMNKSRVQLQDADNVHHLDLEYGTYGTVKVRSGEVRASSFANTQLKQPALQIANGEERYYLQDPTSAQLQPLAPDQGRREVAGLRRVEPTVVPLAAPASGADEGEAIVHFYRPARFVAGGVKLHLTIGDRLYSLGLNDRLTLRVPAGDLATTWKIGFGSKPDEIVIPARGGSELYVECDVTTTPNSAIIRSLEEGRAAAAKMKHVEGSVQL